VPPMPWRRGQARSHRRSPFLDAGRPARRRTSRLRRISLSLLLLAVIAGAAAVVASATSPVARRVRRREPVALPARPRAKTHPAQHAPLPEGRAVDRVLAYTPFVRAGIPRRRLIALTFDDGPSPYTPQIVRVLVRMHAPATFFVVGQQLTYFAAGLRDEVRHGFVIGDHTENHPPLNLMSRALQYAQIRDAALRIEDLGGSFPRLFRPPYGVYDARTLGNLRRLHMLMVMWSVDPRDWVRPGARVIVRRVLAAARPGAIVELHDGGGDRSQTVSVVPAIIRALRRRGYQLVTVPELLAGDPPPHHQRLPHLSE
jgi:peptidoglycan-N-acetylglucosamine deacetylase